MQTADAIPNSAPSTAHFSAPVLCYAAGKFIHLNADGEILELSSSQAGKISTSSPVLVCHAPYTAGKIGKREFQMMDILELYAFIHPTRFCVPTPAGIAKSLFLSSPQDISDYPLTLLESVATLLHDLSNHPQAEKILEIANIMGLNGRGWAWTPFIFQAFGKTYDPQSPITSSRNALNIWNILPEWEEEAPTPPPSNFAVTGDEARAKLSMLLSTRDEAENRPEQVNYTTRLAESFRPPDSIGHPHLTLAEAGTGIGKTLGYLAPSTVWAEKNTGSVTISTYTRNLQRQIASDLERIFPDKNIREKTVTIRKGRENYLCLLNFEDMAASAALAHGPGVALAAGLMARWIMETPDGDITGNSFHGWLPGVIGAGGTLSLADRRGECIFSACDHYHRCFSERIIRKAQNSPLVIANHAVVMIKAAHQDDDLSPHIIFDEGHHVFDAADSAFSAALTGVEAYDLRRWLMGPDGARKSRARGLKKRVEDLIDGDAESIKHLEDILHHATFLPAHDWLQRGRHNNVAGDTEKFLMEVYRQVWARNGNEADSSYSLETQIIPPTAEVLSTSIPLKEKLKSLRSPMEKLSHRLKQKLSEETETLSPDSRKRIEAVAVSLERRITSILSPWIEMLESLQSSPTTGTNTGTDTEYVDWAEIEKIDGKINDIGLHRHYIDPTRPLAQSLNPLAHSITITSATLKDSTSGEDWETAESLTGARHINETPTRFSIPSPYPYADLTRIFVVNDINKNDIDQLSSAYQQLFNASGGGALGLFTSIQRLKSVYKKISTPLSENGLTLYSQHIDGIDIGTLVDMFRDDTHSCLLGTDAVRDGVDVPGESLRMIVFDRVPWPRATILHRERKKVFGGSHYDDRLTRLKLKQAYGRLVRTATDRGVFVMLDSAMPSRLLTAFPEGVQIERLGIAEAIKKSREFLGS